MQLEWACSESRIVAGGWGGGAYVSSILIRDKYNQQLTIFIACPWIYTNPDHVSKALSILKKCKATSPASDVGIRYTRDMLYVIEEYLWSLPGSVNYSVCSTSFPCTIRESEGAASIYAQHGHCVLFVMLRDTVWILVAGISVCLPTKATTVHKSPRTYIAVARINK